MTNLNLVEILKVKIMRNFKNISLEKILQKKFCENFEMFLQKLWEFYVEILRMICGTLRKLYGNFEKYLRKFCKFFMEISWNFVKKICEVYEKFSENFEFCENLEKIFRTFLEIR